MKKTAVIALNSFREYLGGRFYFLFFVFGGITLYLSLVLGLLAQDQEVRALVDFGLAFMELLGLACALYGAATLLLRDLETKTVYLILTRPVTRGQYLLGRYLGLMLSVLALMAAMSALHLALLFSKGWRWDPLYAGALLGSYLKILITTALAFFLALVSTSALTALTASAILWTLGHFLPEIRLILAQHGGSALSWSLKALAYAVPDLELLNIRDRLGSGAAEPLMIPLLYCAAYASAWLAAARALLNNREFQ